MIKKLVAWLFGAKPAKPDQIPTDEVIPVHFFDDSIVNRAIVLDFTLRFDDVLDPERLRSALVRLMEIGKWRKLGARLRLNDAGKLEYHVPTSFSEKRPGFTYTHVKYETSIEEHPLASKLPKATETPSTHPGPTFFSSLARRPDAPKRLEDYIYTDEPQLSVHIVSFEDATLLSLTWPHTFLDAMGRSALFQAWTAVLNGQEDRVPPLHGFNKDPLAPLGTRVTEESVLVKHRISGFNLFKFAVRYVFELLWYRNEESRVICLPGPYLASLRATAMQELADQAPLDSKVKPFVSDGDVIGAWWAPFALQHLINSKRTIVIMNAFGLRSLLSKDLLPAGTAYVSNAVYAVFAILPAGVLFTKPLSYVASQIRNSIQEQGTRPQIEAIAAIGRASIERGGRPDVFGDGTTQLLIYSNWTKARFFEVDFSAAVLEPKIDIPGRQRKSKVLSQSSTVTKRMNKVGTPSYLHSGGFAHGFSTRYSFPIYGKDAAGNYWFSGALRTSAWNKIEQQFAAL